MLAMDVNENAGSLTPSGVLETIASMLAPTGIRDQGSEICSGSREKVSRPDYDFQK